MEARHWLMVAAALLIGGGVAWAAAWWWFGRQLQRAAGQQDRVDKARQFAAQQASQARKQVELLQSELGELRRQLTALKRNKPWTPSAPMPIEPPSPAPEAPDDGFADTQLQLPGKL